MARKLAKTAVEAVLQAQRPLVPAVPEWSPSIEEFTETTGITKKSTALPLNKEQLRVGVAQSLRVNNPYKYIESQTPVAQPWGCYKGHEIGGDNALGMGKNWAVNSNNGSAMCERPQKQTAKIFYSQPSHMHRVPTGHSYQTRGGPWSIMLETGGGGKNLIDGFDFQMEAPQWTIHGFESPDDAAKYAAGNGWAFEVERARVRKHTRKSYADNFKYKPPKK